MNTLPAWDLTPIYPGCDSKEFLEDLHTVVQASKALKADLEAGKADLKQSIERYESVLDYLENLNAYSSACLTTNTSNPLFLKAVSQVEEASW